MENRWGWARWRQRVIALNQTEAARAWTRAGFWGCWDVAKDGLERCLGGRINTEDEGPERPLPLSLFKKRGPQSIMLLTQVNGTPIRRNSCVAIKKECWNSLCIGMEWFPRFTVKWKKARYRRNNIIPFLQRKKGNKISWICFYSISHKSLNFFFFFLESQFLNWLFSFFFGHRAWGIVPWPSPQPVHHPPTPSSTLNPHSPQWKCRILTIEPQGKSLLKSLTLNLRSSLSGLIFF